jgi:hypothetical protein
MACRAPRLGKGFIIEALPERGKWRIRARAMVIVPTI